MIYNMIYKYRHISVIYILRKMQDSIELPESSFHSSIHEDHVNDHPNDEEINFCISPNVSAKKHLLLHNGSQSSLAYSNSTKMFGINTERSPLGNNLPNFDSSNKKNFEYNRMLGKYAATEFPIEMDFQNSEKIPQSYFNKKATEMVNGGPHPQEEQNEKIKQSSDRRKTIHKPNNTNVMNSLAKQKKELEYALQLEIITSQELRTKVSILTELLEQNMKDSELAYFLKLKNSSSLKNVDIFIEMKKSTRKLKECELVIDQQNIEMMKMQEQLTKLTENSRKNHASPSSISFNKENFNTQNVQGNDLCKRIELLEEQKQSLFIYVQQLKSQYQDERLLTQSLKQQIQILQRKQETWGNLERPKLCQQLSQKSRMIQGLFEEIQKLKIEVNLLEMANRNQLQTLAHRKQSQSPVKQEKAIMGIEIGIQIDKAIPLSRSISTQAGSTTQLDILISQLDLLKTERDHYIGKYKKMMEEVGSVHRLKLELSATQNKLQQAKQLNVK